MTWFLEVDQRHRVGVSGCSLTPPQEPCVKVSPHTARAFLRTSRSRNVPLLDKFVASRRRIVIHSGNLAILVVGRLGRSFGRQLRDAPSDGRRSSFAFPGLRRFHRLSCHSRPDRRGHIRPIAGRPWLLRSSHCRLPWAGLAVGLPWNSQGGMTLNGFSMFQVCHRTG